MGRILKTRTGRTVWSPDQKPPYGARLNPHHPLSQGLLAYWLMNEGGGSTLFDATGLFPGSIKTDVSWSGDGLQFSGTTNNYVDFGGSNELASLQVPMTIIGKITPSTTVGYRPTISQYKEWVAHKLIKVVRFDSGQLVYYYNGQTGAKFSGLTISANITYNYAVVISGSLSSASIKFYLENQTNSQSLGSLDSSPDTTVAVRLGNDESAPTEAFAGKIYYHAVYKKALSDAEVNALHANPYQMFWHPMWDLLGAEGVGIFLKTDYWSITAAPQMVANISVISAFLGILVGAVVSATSTVVASLNLVEIIRATISAVSNVIAALGIRRFISAIITATSNIIANIRSSKFVSAVISAVSSMAANLRLSKFVSAIVSSTSNVIAAIKLNKIIRAIISATGSMAANLRLQKIISAIISTTSNVIANIRSSKFISAIISAVSSMAVNLRLRKFVSAIVSAVSSMAANLRLQKFMSAIISATSNVIAALNARKAIAAVISAVSSVYGNLTTVGRIMISSIIIAATTGVEAALWTRKVISATISAASSMYGNITAVALRFISATISATSNVYGNITVALQLAISATIGAISSISANIFAVRAIAAIITAATNVIAALHAIFSIRAVITGVSGMIADIYKAGVGPVVTAGRHLIGYLKRKIEKAINDFLHIE